MKKNLFFLSVLIISMITTGCSALYENPIENLTEDVKIDDSAHVISPQSALKNLDLYFKASSGYSTRSESCCPMVKEIFQIGVRSTRGESDSLSECPIYIANFDNGDGFAILAADDRIDAKVIAVTSKGSIARDDYSEPQSTRTLFKEYPLSGPGFPIISDSNGIEKFINPNTVVYGNQLKGDTLVGMMWNEDLTPISERCDSIDGMTLNIKNMIIGLSLDYAYAKIANNGTDDDDDEDDDWLRGGWGEGDEPSGPHGGENENDSKDHPETDPDAPGGGGDGIKYTEKRISLERFQFWHQKEYVNDLFPRRRLYHNLLESPRVAPTGSFPMAVAKVMAKLKFPQNLRIKDYLINWEFVSKWSSIKEHPDIQYLMAGIAEGMQSQYFYNATYVYPSDAISYMKALGFEDVKIEPYSFERVKSMIDNKYPVIIFSQPHEYIGSSHCWHINKYKYATDYPQKSEYIMVYCDFGDGGNFNGYYAYDVFNPNKDDTTAIKQQSVPYHRNIRIITYRLPQ